jgi:tRNA dimethylallyltransferase
MTNNPIIVIVGPTASGKTQLAINVAKDYNGEIICADSRTVYRSADIGTAKPTVVEQSSIKHWGIDLVDLDYRYTVAEFQQYAKTKIEEIRAKGRLPIIVGGSGLYIDSLVYDYHFGAGADPVLRTKLNSMSVIELQKYCVAHNINLPKNIGNKRHLVRAIELNNAPVSKSKELLKGCIVVGIATEKSVLRHRISLRAKEMFERGVLDETVQIIESYGRSLEILKSSAYSASCKLLGNECDLKGAIDETTRLDMRLVKKQMTWFKRDKNIRWGSAEDINKYIRLELARIIQT